MIYFEPIAEFSHHVIVQIGGIVSDDVIRTAVPGYDLVLNESVHYLLGDICIRRDFNPFGEVVDCH